MSLYQYLLFENIYKKNDLLNNHHFSILAILPSYKHLILIIFCPAEYH